jgi:hypothetical protein
MIIVTGTKRSGTSMWMQVFKAAGLPLIGVPFPRDWGRSIRAANRAGFYESSFRNGIHSGTNPDRRTGRRLRPGNTPQVVVKVFAPGVLRTDRAFLNHVVATMRDVHEYTQSWQRLFAMERAHMERRARARGLVPEQMKRREPMPADLEWWWHNFALLRDVKERGYPMRLRSYASVLENPRQAIEEVFGWLGLVDADFDAAMGAVRCDLRTQIRSRWSRELPTLDRDQTALCEEVYATVHAGLKIAPTLMARFERENEKLVPRIERARQRARQRRLPRRPLSPCRAALDSHASSVDS